jgi:hypothetical protein
MPTGKECKMELELKAGETIYVPASEANSINTNQAQKFDGEKSRLDLIPTSALVAEGHVLKFGAEKYSTKETPGEHNWRKGLKFSQLVGAAMRHITAFNEGEDFDPESGLSHLAHARCCLAFLIEYQTSNSGIDDRYRKET